MSVLISNMEMPTSCSSCRLIEYPGMGLMECKAAHTLLPDADYDGIFKPWKHRYKDCPLVEVPEQKHGKWIGGELGHCSCCGHEGCASDIWNGEMNYCPWCGARMDGE